MTAALWIWGGFGLAVYLLLSLRIYLVGPEVHPLRHLVVGGILGPGVWALWVAVVLFGGLGIVVFLTAELARGFVGVTREDAEMWRGFATTKGTKDTERRGR
jgi:hypothetical protein